MEEILSILEKINKETSGGHVEVFLHNNFCQISPGLEFRIHWGDFHFRHVFSNIEIKSVKDEEILVNYLKCLRNWNKNAKCFYGSCDESTT